VSLLFKGVCGNVGQMFWERLRTWPDLPHGQSALHSQWIGDGRDGFGDQYDRNPYEDWRTKQTRERRGKKNRLH